MIVHLRRQEILRCAQDDSRSAATACRCSSVTWTSWPNQASKPMRPWCSSMPSPSMQVLPRARADASSASRAARRRCRRPRRRSAGARGRARAAAGPSCRARSCSPAASRRRASAARSSQRSIMIWRPSLGVKATPRLTAGFLRAVDQPQLRHAGVDQARHHRAGGAARAQHHDRPGRGLPLRRALLAGRRGSRSHRCCGLRGCRRAA